MERRRITCPETAHLETVDFEGTPFGLVVAGCSRFGAGCAIQCSGECARRFDRRTALASDDGTERVLVVYANASRTRSIANALATELRRDDFIVEVADVDTRAAPPPADYDAVVLGTPVRWGGYAHSVRAYIADHRDALAAMPSFLYVVNRTGTVDVAAFERDGGWVPTRAIGFAMPSWDDPSHDRGPRIHELALAIADEMPSIVVGAGF